MSLLVKACFFCIVCFKWEKLLFYMTSSTISCVNCTDRFKHKLYGVLICSSLLSTVMTNQSCHSLRRWISP
jgi:hypothetical protein